MFSNSCQLCAFVEIIGGERIVVLLTMADCHNSGTFCVKKNRLKLLFGMSEAIKTWLREISMDYYSAGLKVYRLTDGDFVSSTPHNSFVLRVGKGADRKELEEVW